MKKKIYTTQNRAVPGESDATGLATELPQSDLRGRMGWRKATAAFTAFVFAWSMCVSPVMAETINLEGGSVEVNTQENTTNWNVTGNPVWNVPEFNVPQNNIYNISGLSQNASLALLVNGGQASNIFGTMNLSNLAFILQNIAGINIGSSAMINLNNASLLASTIPLNLNATDFFARQYAFSGEGGFLTNDGKIVGNNADLVALIANAIENSGTIEVPMGTVALAAGNTVTVGISPDGMVSIGVDEATANTMGLKDQIKNSGSISADGGKVILNAQAMDGLFEKAISLEKHGNAVSAVMADNGVIELQSLDDIYNEAIIKASGGTVKISAAGHGPRATGGEELRGPEGVGRGSIVNAGTVEANKGKVEITAAKDVTNKATLQADEGLVKVVATQGVITNEGVMKADHGAVQLTADQTAYNKMLLEAIHGKIEVSVGSNRPNPTPEVGSVGSFVNEGTMDATDGSIEMDVAGNIETMGNLTAAYLRERAAAFNIGGEYHVGQSFHDNLDDAITYAANTNVSGTINDIANIVINAGVTVTLTGDTVFNADSDMNGTGLITMATTSTIAGGGYDLTLRASQNSTVGIISNVNLLTFDRQGSYTPTFTGTTSDDISVNTIRTEYGTTFSKDVTVGSNHMIYSVSDAPGGLQYMDQNLGYNYKLANNIDASETSIWNSGAGFDPIGNPGFPYAGTFDGSAHVIAGLTINRPAEDYVGLFGSAASTSQLTNIGLLNISMTGAQYVGALAGDGYGNVSNSYSSGAVSGTDYVGGLVGRLAYSVNGKSLVNSYAAANVNGLSKVGGLVGQNGQASISDSYATGAVVGTQAVGGLVGYHSSTGPGTIANSYASGNVTGSSVVGGLVGEYNGGTILNTYSTGNVAGTSNFGGLIGRNGYGSPVTNSFYDQNTSGQNDNDNRGTPQTTTQMKQQATYSGWTFGDGNGGWVAFEGSQYPHLDWEWSQNITTLLQLQNMNLNLSASYTLANDIDASATAYWNAGAGFDPVGDGTNMFFGDFIGNHHTISDLYINRPTENYVGLFGATNGDKDISNVGFIGGSITGQDAVGFLAGQANYDGKLVSNAYSTGGTVSGRDSVGGLIGWVYHVDLENCYSTNAVSGRFQVGGLAGGSDGWGRHIYNSYATGNVTATGNRVGGLVGNIWYHITVDNSYATGNVIGADEVGGFAGMLAGGSSASHSYSTGHVTATGGNVGGFSGLMNNPYGAGSVSNSYYDSETSGMSNNDGRGTPKTTAEMMQQATFSGWDFDADGVSAGHNGVWIMAGLPHLQMEWTDTITNVTQLQMMALDLDASYTLGNDIDASDTANWNAGAGFDPVGDVYGEFDGSFDGAFFSIDHLSIDRNEGDLGLFARVSSGGDIRNVVLSEVSVTGSEYNVGALVGHNMGSISNVFSSGAVESASGHVGGLVGAGVGTIERSGSSANVIGRDGIGGLVGRSDGTVQSSYATGNATGESHVGGLIGAVWQQSGPGLVINSYATGSVVLVGGTGAGGLVGAGDASITGSYFTDAAHNNGFGILVTDAEMKQSSTFSGWDLTSTWKIYEGYTAPLLKTFLTPLTVTANSATNTYNGSTTVQGNGVTYSATPSSELLGTVSFTSPSKNVGTYIGGLTPGGLYSTQQGYDITFVAGDLTITPRTLTVTAAGVNKTYDGTTAGSVILSDNRVAGDVLTDAYTAAAFADKNVGAGKVVSVSGLSISGTDAANYSLASTSAVASANITAKPITLSGITASDKVYDSTRDVAISTAVATFAGKVAGDDLTVSSSGLFSDKNAANGKTVILTNVLGGADLGNYTISQQGTTTADITAKAITLSGITASNKVYDGTVAATVSTAGAIFNGKVAGDNLTVSSSGVFSDKNVASGKTVTLTNAFGGGDLGNYTITDQGTTSANITAKPITLSGITAANKVYDGTAAAAVSTAGALFNGMVAGDDLTVSSTGLFNNKDVAPAKTVTLTNVLGGADLANYTITNQPTTIANITAIITGAISGIAEGISVALSKNGQAPITTTTTDANGSFQFGGDLYVSAGDKLLVYVNDGSYQANLVGTVSGPANVTGLDLTQGRMIIGDTNAVNLASSYSNADLSTARFANSNVYYTVSGTALTVTGSDLYIPQGVVFTPGGSVTVADDLVVAGTLNAGQNTLSEGGDWSFSNITNLGNVALTGSGAIVSNGAHFNDLAVSGDYGFSDALAVNGTLSVTSGSLVQNANLSAGNYAQTGGTFSDPNPLSHAFSVAGSFSVPYSTSGVFNRYTGSGVNASDPYIIRSIYDLQAMNSDLDSHFKLNNSLDLSAAASWNGGEGFNPIGTQGNPFTGHLHGNGQVLKNLNMHRNGNYSGLFGYVSGNVDTLGLEDATVYGGSYTGALAGFNAGTLTNVYTTGSHTVSGVSFVGGLVGGNTGSIANAYSSARVMGTDSVGGLVGTNSGAGTIDKTYAMGYVNGTSHTGGLVGANTSTAPSSVSNSFWDKKMTGQETSAGGTGAKAVLMVADEQGYETEDPETVMDTTSPDMMSERTYTGWDFANTWVMDEGGTYPHFQFRYPNGVRGVGGHVYMVTTENGITTEGKAGAGQTVSLYYSATENGPETSLNYSTGTGASSRYYGVIDRSAVSDTDFVIGKSLNGSSTMEAKSGSVYPLDIWGSQDRTLVAPMVREIIVVPPTLPITEEIVDRTLVDSAIIPITTPSVGSTLPTVTIVDQTGTQGQNLDFSNLIGGISTPSPVTPPVTAPAAAPVSAPQKVEIPTKEPEPGSISFATNPPGREPVPVSNQGNASSAGSSDAKSEGSAQPSENKGSEGGASSGENASSESEGEVKAEAAVENEDAAVTNQDEKAINWRDVPITGFDGNDDPRKFLTDVRVIEGAVYVIDGANAMSLLGMGDFMRVLYKRRKPPMSRRPVVPKIIEQQGPSSGDIAKRADLMPESTMKNTPEIAPASEKVQRAMDEVLKKTSTKAQKVLEEPEATPVVGQPVRKIAAPVVMRETVSGDRYGTLKNPGKNVFVKSQGGDWQPAADGMVILPGDQVKTADSSSVEMVMDGGKTGKVEIKEGSLFRILQAETDPSTGDKRTVLDLALGKILVKVESLKGSSKFEVRTPTALTGVRGTIFEVTVKEKV